MIQQKILIMLSVRFLIRYKKQAELKFPLAFAFIYHNFMKSIDNSRSNIPPDWETDKNCIVIRKAVWKLGNLRTKAFIVHFNRRTAVIVCPVEVGSCVRRLRLDFKQVCACCLCEFFCHCLSVTAWRKICY